MNIKKLLATTAIAALAATGAHAQTTLVLGNGDANVGIIVAQNIANELNLAVTGGTPLDGDFEFVLTPLSALGAGPHTVEIDLPEGIQFSANVDPDIALATAGNTSLQTVGTPLGVGVPALTIGGAAGSREATLTYTPGATGDTALQLSLPLRIVDCGTSGVVTVTVAEVGTANSFAGSTAAAIVDCDSGFNTAITGTAGIASGALETSIASGFTLFTGGAGTTGTLGTVRGFIDATAFTTFGTTTAGLTPVDEDDVASVEFDVVFEDASGIASVTLATTPPITVPRPTTGTTNVFTFSTVDGNVIDDLYAAPIALIANVAAAPTGGTRPMIADQSVSIANSNITFATGGATFGSGEEFTAGTLASITRDALVFGPFDWVGSNVDGARNIFRFTGLTADSVPGEVAFTNCSTGTAVAGRYVADLTLNTSAGEGLVISSGGTQNDDLRTLAAAAVGGSGASLGSDFGRCDITYSLFTGGSIDVDRLLLRGDVLSSFGNSSVAGNPIATSGDD